MADWRLEQQQVKMAIEGLKSAEIGDRALNAERIFELANKSYSLYVSQDSTETAKLVRMLFSNYSVSDVSVTPAYRKPFDTIFETVKNENGRGERIRTSDPLVPNQVRYQTALRPENCFAIMSSIRRGAHPWSRHLGCACKARVIDSYEFIRVLADAGARADCPDCGDLREDSPMMERRQLVSLWKRDSAGVLVTLVRVEGSSYRRPGALLLTRSAGAGHAGTISGGCLESEVIRRAQWIAREQAAVERYATTFDDTSDIPFGLGCGGTVELLFEAANNPEGEALMQAMAESLEGREFLVVSFLPGGGRGLRRVIFDAAGEVVFASPALNQHKIECARGLSPDSTYDGRFVERLQAPQRLFVLGAGEDAKPLVEMASLLGWTVIVADGRANLATAARFPKANEVRVLPPEGEHGLKIGPKDAVILMTHSYEQDRSLLTGLLPIGPRYLGLLGSRHRSSILVAESAAMLGRSVDDCCERIFAPVGMDLGGDGPEAVALSIVAEVQAVATGKVGGSRRLSATEIQAQIELGGSSKYLQAQCAMDAQ